MRSVQTAPFSDCESSQFEQDTLVLPAESGLRRFFTKKVAAAISVGAVLLLAPAAVHLSRAGAHGASLDLSTELDEAINAAPKMENCADTDNNCFGNKCCKTTGYSCWNTGGQTGKCSLLCPPGTPCWVEKAYYAFQPKTHTLSTSMYCYTVHSFNPAKKNETKAYADAAAEVSILKTQLKNGVGIFQCNNWQVFADGELELSPGPPVRLVATIVQPRAEYGTYQRKDKPLFVNTPLFMSVWQTMKQTTPHAGFSWIIKVDGPTVFLPDNLRTKLAGTSVPDTGIYIENCKKVLEGFFGNIEIASQEAFRRFLEQVEDKYGADNNPANCWRQLSDECKKQWKYGTWGEDRFFQDVVDSAGVEKIQDFAITDSGTCPGSRPDSEKDNAEYVPVCKPGQPEAAVHPFRTPEAWFKCLGTITVKSYSS